MWAACREAACQRINETLPKDLERQPLAVWIQDSPIIGRQPILANNGPPYLKGTRSKALEPGCFSPQIFHCNTVSERGKVRGIGEELQ